MTDRQSDTDTIIAALEILSQAIDSEDGVANAAIAEGAQRLRDMQRKVEHFRSTAADAEAHRDRHWQLVIAKSREIDQLHAEVDMLKRSRQMDANEANSREHISRAEVEALRSALRRIALHVHGDLSAQVIAGEALTPNVGIDRLP